MKLPKPELIPNCSRQYAILPWSQLAPYVFFDQPTPIPRIYAFLRRWLPLPLATFAPLAFNCSRISTAFELFKFKLVCRPPPLALPLPISSTTLFGSAAPMTGTSDASHCWKGFATK